VRKQQSSVPRGDFWTGSGRGAVPQRRAGYWFSKCSQCWVDSQCLDSGSWNRDAKRERFTFRVCLGELEFNSYTGDRFWWGQEFRPRARRKHSRTDKFYASKERLRTVLAFNQGG